MKDVVATEYREDVLGKWRSAASCCDVGDGPDTEEYIELASERCRRGGAPPGFGLGCPPVYVSEKFENVRGVEDELVSVSCLDSPD